jgi:hypothetical protein
MPDKASPSSSLAALHPGLNRLVPLCQDSIQKQDFAQ